MKHIVYLDLFICVYSIVAGLIYFLANQVRVNNEDDLDIAVVRDSRQCADGLQRLRVHEKCW